MADVDAGFVMAREGATLAELRTLVTAAAPMSTRTRVASAPVVVGAARGEADAGLEEEVDGGVGVGQVGVLDDDEIASDSDGRATAR